MRVLARILRISGIVLLAAILLSAIAYPFRRDPIGPISGKALTGEEVPQTPTDWGFTNDHNTIAVEVRPDDPHSVTTICFLHDGVLYVPARDGAEKDWPRYVIQDPRVRLKIGDRIYPARAQRVPAAPEMRASLIESARAKYARMPAPDDPEARQTLENLWLFAIGPR